MGAEGFTGPYRLIVSMNLPEYVIEGELFNCQYVYTNDSGVHFPGIHTGINITWPEIGEALTVYDPTDVGELDVDGKQTFQSTHTPPTSGMTVFTVRMQTEAVDGIPVRYYLPDGRQITQGQLIGAVPIQSREEVLQVETIRTLKASIESQDRLTETQNKLARISVFIGAADVFVAIAALILAWIVFRFGFS